MVIRSLKFEENAFAKTSKMSQIAVDWDTKPLVDITITTDDECPSGTELIMYKPWLGTKLWCVCAYEGQHKGESFYRHYGGECNEQYSQDYKGQCFQLEALNPVLMGQFQGSRVCGYRGGDSFKEV